MKYITSIILFAIIAVSGYMLLTIPTITINTGLVTVPYEYLTKHEKEEIDCLTANILYESASESTEGQVAVATVTLNRVKSDKFETTICKVVQQKTNGVCQFSWWCDASLKEKYLRKSFSEWRRGQYEKIRDIAILVYFNHGLMEDPSEGALYYHADYVNPQWNLKKTTTIGRHIFYKPKEDTTNVRKA